MDSAHPITVALTVLAGLAVLTVRRDLAIAPIILAICFMPMSERVSIGQYDLPMLRILATFAVVRVVMRGEFRGLRFLRVDGLLLGFTFVSIAAFTFRVGTTEALVNRLGWAIDGLAIYAFSRCSLRTERDVLRLIEVAVGCCVVTAALMFVEWTTGRNLFSVFGGVEEYSLVRAGRVRAQGAFSHPILAGLFGAAWFPIFVSLWYLGQQRMALVGSLSAFAIIGFSSSSTPVAGLLIGIAGLCIWRIRSWVPLLCYSALPALALLHILRDKPVWHLLSRIKLIGGSTGWHRYHLIDQAIDHFDEWWLLGTSDTRSWGPYLQDITNEYLLAGIRGGFLSMALLLALVWAGFRCVGRAARCQTSPKAQRFFAWAVGSTFLVHAVSFISVSYFGQLRAVWFLHLALAATQFEWIQRKHSPQVVPALVRPPLMAAHRLAES